jgi:hypothetical protein
VSRFFRNIDSSDIDLEIQRYLKHNLKSIGDLKETFIFQIIREFTNNKEVYKNNIPYEFFASEYSPTSSHSTLTIVGNLSNAKPLSKFISGKIIGSSSPQKLFLKVNEPIMRNDIKRLEVYVREDIDYFQFNENLDPLNNPKAFLKGLKIVGSDVPQRCFVFMDKAIKDHFSSIEVSLITDDSYLQFSTNFENLVTPKDILSKVIFISKIQNTEEPSVLKIYLKEDFYTKVDKVRIYLTTDSEYLQGEIVFSPEELEYAINIYGSLNNVYASTFRFEFLKSSEVVLDVFSSYQDLFTLHNLDYFSVSSNIYIYDWNSFISLKLIGEEQKNITLRLQELDEIFDLKSLSFVGNVYLDNPENKKIVLLFKDDNDSIVYQFTLSKEDLENANTRFFDENLLVKVYLSADIPYLIESSTPIFRRNSDTIIANINISKSDDTKSVGYFEVFYKNEKVIDIWEQTYLPVSYYNFPIKGRFYSYDWALGILSLLTEYKLAKNVNTELANNIRQVITYSVKNFTSWINADGSVNFFYGKYTPYTDKYVRNGAVAWVLEALIKVYNEEEFRTAQISSSISSIINYLLSQKNTSTGLIMGGLNRYGPNWELIEEQITWMSSEHNVDFYFCLKEICDNSSVYSSFLDIPTICNEKELLKNAIKTHLYIESEGRIRQGYNDDAGALDLYTWGTQFLYSVEEDLNKVYKNYQCSDIYKIPEREFGYIEGYRAYSEDLGHPNSKKYIWLEGTFQRMYVSALIYKIKRFDLLKRLGNIFSSNYNFLPYSIGKDENYEIGEYPSLAATAWFLFVYYLYARNIKSYWE